MTTCMTRNAALVKRLLELGAKGSKQIKDEMNVLMYASLHGDRRVVKMLLDADHNDLNVHVIVCATDKWGNSASTLVAYKGFTEIVELLLKVDAPIDRQNKNGESALLIAARRAHLSAIQLMLHGCADLQVVDMYGNRAMSLVSMLIGRFGRPSDQASVLGDILHFLRKAQPKIKVVACASPP